MNTITTLLVCLMAATGHAEEKWLVEFGVGSWASNLGSVKTSYALRSDNIGDIRATGPAPAAVVMPLALLVRTNQYTHMGAELDLTQKITTESKDFYGNSLTSAQMNYTNTALYFVYRRVFYHWAMSQAFLNGAAGFIKTESFVEDKFDSPLGFIWRNVDTTTISPAVKLGLGVNYNLSDNIQLSPRADYVFSRELSATLPEYRLLGWNIPEKTLNLGSPSGLVLGVSMGFKF